MAVTPVGNPYVESSDLVANYPGASEALAERIDVVGVNPFADSAARATAIPSPVEGQMASLNDDDKVYRYSGSAWVAVGLPPGLNPVAPTSIANSGGSASTTLNTTTFTEVTSISLNGVFSATYDNYKIIVDSVGSVTLDVTLRYRSAGTDNTSTSYRRQIVRGTYADSATGSGLSNTNVFFVDRFNGGSERHGFAGDFYLPYASAYTTFLASYINSSGAGISAGWFNATTSFDGFSLTASSGNITGTIRVYGYSN
jgi:hypothetical protein